MVPDRPWLKLLRRRSDPSEVFCAYCGAPLTLRKKGDDESDLELEEDF
jgi:hypothetical protein